MHCCEKSITSRNTAAPVDPVCGMTVENPHPKLVVTHGGHKYYFCAEACMKEFKKHPKRCLLARKRLKPEKKGLWGRYLDRLNKATNGQAIKCH